MKRTLITLCLLLFASNVSALDITSTAELAPAVSGDGIFVLDASEAAASQPKRILFDGDSTKFLNGVGGFTAPPGLGDVVGPASSVDTTIAIYDSSTGKLLTSGTGCTISGGTISCTGGFVSIADDGDHFADITNGVTITAPTDEGNFSYFTDRFWIADGSDWVSRYIFDSSLTIPEANIDADIARDNELLTVISGTSAMGTSEIASGACATTVTTTATGAATTDVISGNFNATPLATTGYAASSNGGLFIYAWPTTNNVNFSVCNNTVSAITPGAVTLNWQVIK